MAKKGSKGSKKSSQLVQGFPKLTGSRLDVLYLLKEGCTEPKRLHDRLGLSISYVYRVLRFLKEKGFIDNQNQVVQKVRCTMARRPNQIRLHGQEFNIKIIWKNPNYKSRIGKTISIDENTVRCYRDSIEVYGNLSFYGRNVHQATSKSIKYWQKYFRRLEDYFKIVIVKHRYENIKLVNQHYAEINNELAEECEKRKYGISVFTREDGKLWFTIDNSFNLHEAETQHPETAKEDMQDVVRPFFNDLRDSKPPLPSELRDFISQTQSQLQELAAAQLNTTNQLNMLISAITPQSNGKVDDEDSLSGVSYFG